MVVKNITGTYNLVADSSWGEVNNNEIRLLCNTTSAPVIINLPEIVVSGIQNYNATIIVVDTANNAATNRITINAGGSDKIGSDASEVIKVNGGSTSFKVASNTNWLATASAEQDGNFSSYVALLTETGTAAPTAVIMQNSLGVVPTLARTSAGIYTVTATGKFTVGKTFCSIPVNGQDVSYTVDYTSVDVITISTKVLTTGVLTDAILTNAAVEIRVYP
jgi:hypothetical protein